MLLGSFMLLRAAVALQSLREASSCLMWCLEGLFFCSESEAGHRFRLLHPLFAATRTPLRALSEEILSQEATNLLSISLSGLESEQKYALKCFEML